MKITATAILALIVGTIAGYLFAASKKTEQSQARDDATISTLQKQTGAAETRASQADARVNQLQQQVMELQKDRDNCLSRFTRSTILYDGTVFENRRWVIPADVEPVLLGAEGRASYAHYDPKTQTETVKMRPHSQ